MGGEREEEEGKEREEKEGKGQGGGGGKRSDSRGAIAGWVREFDRASVYVRDLNQRGAHGVGDGPGDHAALPLLSSFPPRRSAFFFSFPSSALSCLFSSPPVPTRFPSYSSFFVFFSSFFVLLLFSSPPPPFCAACPSSLRRPRSSLARSPGGRLVFLAVGGGWDGWATPTGCGGGMDGWVKLVKNRATEVRKRKWSLHATVYGLS